MENDTSRSVEFIWSVGGCQHLSKQAGRILMPYSSPAASEGSRMLATFGSLACLATGSIVSAAPVLSCASAQAAAAA